MRTAIRTMLGAVGVLAAGCGASDSEGNAAAQPGPQTAADAALDTSTRSPEDGQAVGDMAAPDARASGTADVDGARTAVLAATPPMGWNSWNRFGCNVSESLIQGIADAMVSSGMKDAGYTYVNIDDCWQVKRDASGTIVADPTTFPSGIQALADYVHGKGLKLGVYSDRGTATCAGRPGSEGHEDADAKTYASWGVDYLKYDNCNATLDAKTQYQTMSAALAQSGRPIVFSICAWSFADWMPATGQLWRTTGDIQDNWASVSSIIDTNASLAGWAGPGHYNDPDMLEVGNGGMTDTEYRAHFALWAMMAAPLIAGNDIRSMPSATKDILTAPEIVLVDQDPLGIQGSPVKSGGGLEVWSRPLAGAGVRAVALFNRSAAPADITVAWSDILLEAGSAAVRDLWASADLGTFVDRYTTNVASHGAVMLKIAGKDAKVSPPAGTSHLSDLKWRSATNGWGPVERDMSNGENAAGDGRTITIAGKTYAKGLGVHAMSEIHYTLSGVCSSLTAEVGPDDEKTGGTVAFQVWADGTKLYDSATMASGASAKSVSVDVSGKQDLALIVTDAGDGDVNDHADWADAKVTCSP